MRDKKHKRPPAIIWSPDLLDAQLAELSKNGWDSVAYWFSTQSGDRGSFVLTGCNPARRAQAYESFTRIHKEGGMPIMRYHLSDRPDPPSVDREICRISCDGLTVIACDFTGLAGWAVQMGRSTRAEVVKEEQEACAEILALLPRSSRKSAGGTN